MLLKLNKLFRAKCDRRKMIFVIQQWRGYSKRWYRLNRLNLWTRGAIVDTWLQWREAARLTRVERLVAEMSHNSSRRRLLRKTLKWWIVARKRKRRCQCAVDILTRVYARVSLREALQQWPGRWQWEAAECMRLRNLRKGRGRIRIADGGGFSSLEKFRSSSSSSLSATGTKIDFTVTSHIVTQIIGCNYFVRESHYWSFEFSGQHQW